MQNQNPHNDLNCLAAITRPPRVSVLLPVYNGEAYLEEAIQSVLDQTYVDFECIIINDGSKDGSAAIINKFNDARIRAYHQENHGLASTLNRAITLAQGQYLARQDQDDLSLPQRFEKQVSFLETHLDYGMVGTWAEIWTEKNKTERVHRHPADNQVLKYELLFDNPFVHSSMMIRKAVFENVGLYTTDSLRCPPEDYELWSRIARTFKVANIPEILQVYREVPRSISRVGSNPFLEKLLRISAENIALAAGKEIGDRRSISLAALAHGAYQHLESKLSYRELAVFLYEAADGLCTAGEKRQDCLLKNQVRKRFRSLWLRYLKHRYPEVAGKAVRSLLSFFNGT